ncbi:hypothetical protein N9D61_07910 [Planktomarina sp.]|jgi:hypothetical protein|nr:hypothetical protein [Planktomarina sp.]
MAYTIFNTRNNELAVVEDGTIDNTTDLKLIGKNYAGYGEIQNENFIYLLENFAGANQPPRPIAGQLWFDTTDQKLKAYDGNNESVFVPLGNVHIGAKPSGAAITAANVNKGDLWWDDVTSQLYAHNGALAGDPFVLVGPLGSQDVKTIIEDTTVYDSLFAGQPDPTPYQHKILKGFINDTVVFVMSDDEFTLDDSNAIAGFDRIKKGITLVNTQNANNGVTTGNYEFHGSSSNALRLGGTLAAEFVQRTNPVFTTQVDIDDNDGLQIGPNNELLLKISGNEPIIESTVNGSPINLKVKDSGGSTVTPAQITATGILPSADASSGIFNLGSSNKRWNEVHALNFKGTADKADQLLSNGTYKNADKANTIETIVTRDSVGDIFGTAFRGTALYNSTDATAALTARVTKADGVQVDGTSTYANATVTSTADKVAIRDSSGDLFANQFNGVATRAATVQVSTGVNVYEYRTASVANSGSDVPNSVAIRDAAGSLYANEFIGELNGTANTAGRWTSPMTLSLTGDVSGSVSFDGSSDVSVNVTSGSNSIALGTDTTGNYVQSIAARAGQSDYINIFVDNVLDGAAGETRSVQIGLSATTTNAGSNLVARDASGNFAANDITGEGVITANTRLVGNVNQAGTSNDGWFDNLNVGTLNVTSFVPTSTVTIAQGGTSGTTAAEARTNLDVYSKAETYTQAEVDSQITAGVGGVSTTSISNGTSSVSVANSADTTFVHAGVTIGAVKATGIDLESGFEFIGTATQAEYADLAEKYSTAEELPNGTVVAVGRMPGHEVDPANRGDIAIGVVSTDPALKMNSKAEGQYIGLKGRLPIRVIGAVKKGDAVYVDDNGCASRAINGGSMVGIALETVSIEEEKLVECVLKV